MQSSSPSWTFLHLHFFVLRDVVPSRDFGDGDDDDGDDGNGSPDATMSVFGCVARKDDVNAVANVHGKGGLLTTFFTMSF